MMTFQFARRIARAASAFAVAAAVLVAPFSTSAATAAGLSPDSQTETQALQLRPDIVVTGVKAVLVNSNVYYMFEYKNIGNFKAQGVVLTKKTEVHHLDGSFAWYETETQSVADLQPGESRTTMVKCKWQKGTTHYCLVGYLEAKVTKGAAEYSTSNNLGYVGVDSRTVK